MQSNVIYYSRQVSLFGPHHAIGNCLVYYTLQLSLFGRHHFPFLGLIMQLFDLLNFKLPSLGLIMPSFCLLTFNFPSLGLIMPLVVVPNLNFPFLGSSYTWLCYASGSPFGLTDITNWLYWLDCQILIRWSLWQPCQHALTYHATQNTSHAQNCMGAVGHGFQTGLAWPPCWLVHGVGARCCC